MVEDDGVGMPRKRGPHGLGLHIMSYRAKAIGGDLDVRKRRGGGTRVTCTLPLGAMTSCLAAALHGASS